MPRSLLLEIGCEELPTSFVDAAMEQLARIVPEEFTKARIAHGVVRVLGTPRRLAVLVADVREEIAVRTEELLGPAESAARGADGAWTKAAEGFARKNEVALADLTIAETPKGRYVRAVRTHAGATTTSVLGDVLGAVIRRITFAKSMRWADIETPFGRPVQWLVALFGGDVVPFEFVRVKSGRTTRGHRFLAPDAFDLADAGPYVDRLRDAHVLVDPVERRSAQDAALEVAARGLGGVLVRNAQLENEVLGLVEEPFAIGGAFDPKFLELPEELIETVMSHHQRYFAVRAPSGKLMAAFITTTNTALDPATIRKGNESVMTARLSDARFFNEQDRALALDARVARLDGVVFHQKLGSYGDKVKRVEGLVDAIAKLVGADPVHAKRAARLSKADLVSLTVGEFPELQGIVGKYAARHDGEDESVALAIEEHYQPKGADDAVAQSKVGAALAIADRLDTLVGFFAIGQKPSGAGDPFGLRRAALGMIRTLVHHRVRMKLSAIEQVSAQEYATQHRLGDQWSGVVDFVRERLEGLLAQRFPLDVVRACMAAGYDDPVDVVERVEALAAFRGQPEFANVVRAFERVFNISRKAPAGEPELALLAQPAEMSLVEAFAKARPRIAGHIAKREFDAALRVVADGLPGAVDRFFTDVFVMDDAHPELRDARLRLLGRIADEVGRMARFDALAAG